MFDITSPGRYVIAQLELLSNEARLSDWINQAPASCGGVDSITEAERCIADVCKLTGRVRNPEANARALAFILAGNLYNPALYEVSRGVNAGLVDRFKDDFCMDPPSDGLMSLVEELGQVHAQEPVMARNASPDMTTPALALLGAKLVYDLFCFGSIVIPQLRGAQPVLHSFFPTIFQFDDATPSLEESQRAYMIRNGA